MSKTMLTKSITPPAIQARKGGPPIVFLTSYTAPMTRLVDPHADLILVGDSLAMTIYGMDSTVGVTEEMMIAHWPCDHPRCVPCLRRGRPAVRLV